MIRNDYYGTASWKKTRLAILKRDNWKCRICGKRASRVHHIVPRRKGGTDEHSNLLSLCELGHRQIHPWLKPPPEPALQEKYPNVFVPFETLFLTGFENKSEKN